MPLQKTGTGTVQSALARPVPQGLQDPDQWVLVTQNYIPNVARTLVWHKIADPKHPERFSESFEFVNTPRTLSPEASLEKLRESNAKTCPTGVVKVISLTETDLTAETRPCGPLGEEDSISRWISGAHDTFYVSYNVKAAEMTPAQRQQGLAAVSAWNVTAGRSGL